MHPALLGDLQELTASFPAWSLTMSPFALAWVLSHAAVDLGEGEDDKSCDIMVLTFPLWQPSCDDSLGFCPVFQRKWVCINVTSVQPPAHLFLLHSPPNSLTTLGLVGPKSGALKVPESLEFSGSH